jgi:predicted RNA binding protein YcfA (HicA-like mRNA interferase family)
LIIIHRDRCEVVKVREIIKELEDDGWYLVRYRGSHRQFHHATKPGTVTVSGAPSRDLPKQILASIVRQAGLERRLR